HSCRRSYASRSVPSLKTPRRTARPSRAAVRQSLSRGIGKRDVGKIQRKPSVRSVGLFKSRWLDHPHRPGLTLDQAKNAAARLTSDPGVPVVAAVRPKTAAAATIGFEAFDRFDLHH